MKQDSAMQAELLACCVQLCSQVLHKPTHEIRTDAGFFEQGGTSLSLMHLAALLEAARPELFGPSGADVQGLMQAPVIADMPQALLQASERVPSLIVEGEL